MIDQEALDEFVRVPIFSTAAKRRAIVLSAFLLADCHGKIGAQYVKSCVPDGLPPLPYMVTAPVP
jgi:hypothetical protein